ncbi:ARM repeats containing protein [Cardiosporidium cionae]|uniref:ARM repeats containing protein n=1 Tax=Cardiosporidium cionae TaxID=476202 RepID=A0ABQ7J6X0_9APIC|nr:ARM repeats containing protein [Cardiosporidium cionae]|eukprot:KAF8819748.1 ARM repeats containing protein [Cardiosporidium cionae]
MPVCVKTDDDVARFDRAYDNNDIEEFVKLSYSNCKIQNLPQHIHPWAADPETVGALAATQLAILASKDDTPEYKNKIREAGGITALVDLLKSTQNDRLHAAVVALSFLSDNNIQNCIGIYEAGAMPLLVEGMKSNIDGMRAACAQAARNIYVLGLKYRKEFLRVGGIQNLIKFLDLPSDPDSQPLYTQFEAIYHLEDFILVSKINAIFVKSLENNKIISSYYLVPSLFCSR